MARPAPAASRAVRTISYLAAHPTRGFTLSELVNRLGINVASLHATLAILEDAGFVVRDPVHRTYVLGPALAAVGFATLQQHPAIELALEKADALGTELGFTMLLTARAGVDAIFVARRGPEANEDVPGYPGDKVPLMAPFGAVFVAWGSESAIDEWLARANTTSDAADHYLRVLAEIRARGYAVPLRAMSGDSINKGITRLRDDPTDQDATSNLAEALHDTDERLYLLDELDAKALVPVQTIAAPIFDAAGQVQLALNITGPHEMMTTLEVHRLGRRLVRATTAMTKQTRGIAPSRSA